MILWICSWNKIFNWLYELPYVVWKYNDYADGGCYGYQYGYFEASDLDGCNSIQRFYYITLPLIRPILAYTLITSIIGGLQMFDVPQI